MDIWQLLCRLALPNDIEGFGNFAQAALAVIGLSNIETPTLGSIVYWALSYNALFTGQYLWVVAPVVSGFERVGAAAA